MVELEQSVLDGIADNLLQIAKQVRAGFRYSEDDRMVAMAALILGDGEVRLTPLPWGDQAAKHKRLGEVARTARREGAIAIALISDARWVKSDSFCAYFGLPGVKEMEVEVFKGCYAKILGGYGGEMQRLPRQLWTEAVVVSLKGPGVEPRIRMAGYVEGRRDRVEWLPAVERDDAHTRVEVNMLPDWWVVE